MKFILGLILSIVGGYLYLYFLQDITIPSLDKELSHLVVLSGVFLGCFIIYYLIDKIIESKFLKQLDILNQEITMAEKENSFDESKITDKKLKHIAFIINSLLVNYKNIESKLKKELLVKDEDLEMLEDMLDYTDGVLLARVSESNKLIKGNKSFFKFFNIENEVKFNLQYKSVTEIFDDEISLSESNNNEVNIKGYHFLLDIVKIPKRMEFIFALRDVSIIHNKLIQTENKLYYANKNLFTIHKLNPKMETLLIKILNFENYVELLPEDILELFEENFVNRIKELGYNEVFKVDANIYAVYDLKVDFNKYKKTLEDSLLIEFSGGNFEANPRVILASGVNFSQAYQQIMISAKTMISKIKDENKYEFEDIKDVNKSIINKNVKLGLKKIKGLKNHCFIYPIITSMSNSNYNISLKIARELNIYLPAVKSAILNNLATIRDLTIIIDINTDELLSTTLLIDLLSAIKREGLDVVFNVDITSKYDVVYPILRQIKAYAKLSIKNGGRGFLSFKDIYALKIDFIEVSEDISSLVKSQPEWKFLLDSMKMLVAPQNTKLIAHNYNDEKVFEIDDNMQII